MKIISYNARLQTVDSIISGKLNLQNRIYKIYTPPKFASTGYAMTVTLQIPKAYAFEFENWKCLTPTLIKDVQCNMVYMAKNK